jgi:HPt (histidine-containing phosphotransfer) domain-containing protein
LARKSAHSKAAPSFERLADKVADQLADKPAMDAVDRAYLARFTLGNVALEREVLELFAAQAPVYLQRLREANCIKAWREATHTIKGSASAIGARRLAHLAEMAEKVDVEADIALREGHRDEAVAAVAIAAEEVCRFIARLYPAT